ncbi:MAG: hypothetical protein WC558_05575 [Patulibacter sp.]
MIEVISQLFALIAALLEVAFAPPKRFTQNQMAEGGQSFASEIIVGVTSGALGVVTASATAYWRTRRQNRGAARLLLADLQEVHGAIQFVYDEGDLAMRQGEKNPYDLQSLCKIHLPHWEGSAEILGASLRKKRWIQVLDAVDVVESRARGDESVDIDDDFARSSLGKDLVTVQDAIEALTKISAWDAPNDQVRWSREVYGLETLLSDEELEFREAGRFWPRARFQLTRPFTWRRRRRIENGVAAEMEAERHDRDES